MDPVRYKSLSLSEKKQVIEAVAGGGKKKDIALQFHIPASTLSTILKQKDRLAEITPHGSRKRESEGEFPQIEECLKTFSQCRQENIPIGGPILKEKASLLQQVWVSPTFKPVRDG